MQYFYENHHFKKSSLCKNEPVSIAIFVVLSRMVAENVVTDRPTDGRNDKSNTVILAAPTRQWLISQYNHYDQIHFYLSSTTQRGTTGQCDIW